MTSSTSLLRNALRLGCLLRCLISLNSVGSKLLLGTHSINSTTVEARAARLRPDHFAKDAVAWRLTWFRYLC